MQLATLLLEVIALSSNIILQAGRLSAVCLAGNETALATLKPAPGIYTCDVCKGDDK